MHTDSTGRKIVTHNDYPPIPSREFDWVAFYDDTGEETGEYGYSATEEGAIENLICEYGPNGWAKGLKNG